MRVSTRPSANNAIEDRCEWPVPDRDLARALSWAGARQLGSALMGLGHALGVGLSQGRSAAMNQRAVSSVAAGLRLCPLPTFNDFSGKG